MKFSKIALTTVAVAGLASTTSAHDSGAYINVGVDTYEFDVYNLGGIQYFFTETYGIRLEYTYLDASGGKADTAGELYIRQF